MTKPLPVSAPSTPSHPGRRTLRALVAGLVAVATTVPALLAGVNAEGAIGQVVGVLTLVTRLMATPQVEDWLHQYAPWLASAPPPETN